MSRATARNRTTPRGVYVEIPAGRDAPACARDALAPLSDVVAPPCLETLELVVSELVTNAVRHSGVAPGDPVEMEVECDGGRVRIAVADPGAGFEHGANPPQRGTLGGWGLYLVGEVVESWHVEARDDRPGIRVVADIPLSDAALRL